MSDDFELLPAASNPTKFKTLFDLAELTDDEQRQLTTALGPWLCDVLRSKRSVEAYVSDLEQFLGTMKRQGVSATKVTADHVKVYKAALLQNHVRPASVARKLSVIRGAYRQLADKGFVAWETAQGIASVAAPNVNKNSTPCLTRDQAITLLQTIPTDTLQGKRDLGLLQTFFSTGCRVTAICGARVGDLDFDGSEFYLSVTEKRGRETRKILLEAANPIRKYMEAARIDNDRMGPLFRPLLPNGTGFVPRHLNRKTPWRLVKKYCRLAGIESERLTGRGIGVHSLRKTAITDAIRNGASMHEVREFAGHADIRTTELYYHRREEDAEHAARRIQIYPDFEVTS